MHSSPYFSCKITYTYRYRAWAFVSYWLLGYDTVWSASILYQRWYLPITFRARSFHILRGRGMRRCFPSFPFLHITFYHFHVSSISLYFHVFCLPHWPIFHDQQSSPHSPDHPQTRFRYVCSCLTQLFFFYCHIVYKVFQKCVRFFSRHIMSNGCSPKLFRSFIENFVPAMCGSKVSPPCRPGDQGGGGGGINLCYISI
jgi:hypothetical protein